MIKTLSFLFSILLLSACSAKEVNNASNPPAENNSQPELITSYDDRAAAYQDIMLGRIAAGQQRYQEALDFYLSGLKYSNDVSLIREALSIAEQLNQHDVSVSLAKKWLVEEPETALAWQLIAYHALKNEQTDEALEALDALLKFEKDPERLALYLSRISALPNRSYVKAQLEKTRDRHPANPELSLHIIKLLEADKSWLLAITEIDRLIFNQPDYEPAYELKGEMLKSSGAIQSAISWYGQTLERFPANQKVLYELGQLYYDTDQYSKALEKFEGLLKLNPDNVEARYMIAAGYYAQKAYAESKQYFEPLLKVKRLRNTILYYLGEMEREQNNPLEAVAYYRQITRGQFYQNAHLLVASLMFEAGQYEDALNHLEKQLNRPQLRREERIAFEMTKMRLMVSQGVEEGLEANMQRLTNDYPDEARIQLYRLQYLLEQERLIDAQSHWKTLEQRFNGRPEYKGLALGYIGMLQNAGENANALELVDNLINETPEDLEFLYSKAMVAAGMEDFATTESSLRELLKLSPDYTDALNALGYTLADMNKNLPEAEALLNRALAAEPDNAAILDSMGWLRYRQGRAEESLKLIERAYEKDQSGEITAHLVEVLWHLGFDERAILILKQALEQEPESRYLNRLTHILKSEEPTDDAE